MNETFHIKQYHSIQPKLYIIHLFSYKRDYFILRNRFKASLTKLLETMKVGRLLANSRNVVLLSRTGVELPGPAANSYITLLSWHWTFCSCIPIRLLTYNQFKVSTKNLSQHNSRSHAFFIPSSQSLVIIITTIAVFRMRPRCYSLSLLSHVPAYFRVTIIGSLRTVYKLIWSSKFVRTYLSRRALSAIVPQHPGE